MIWNSKVHWVKGKEFEIRVEKEDYKWRKIFWGWILDAGYLILDA
jgi:hypothetical protein